MADPFATEPAVIVTCPECGARSKPVDPTLPASKARFSHETQEGFEQQHREMHAKERRKVAASETGHEIKVVTTCMEMDHIEERATCSCGWSGRSLPPWQAQLEADAHAQEVLDG